MHVHTYIKQKELYQIRSFLQLPTWIAKQISNPYINRSVNVFKEKDCVYRENKSKHKKTVWQNAEFLNVTSDGTAACYCAS